MTTTPEPPSGRRSNGLPSAEWGALVDLDPRLSEALLGSLGAVGVPAYVEPAGGTVDSYTRAVNLPNRPLDRLWVDPAQEEQARAVVGAEVAELTALLAEEDPAATAHGFVQPVPRTAAAKVLRPPVLPEPPGRPAQAQEDPDEAWRQIVEGWTRDSDAPVPPWPVSEDVDDDSPPPFSAPAPRKARRRSDESEEDALPSYLEPDKLEDDGHYVPPPPPPVPKVRRHTVGALTALLIGLVLVFAPELIGQVQSVGLGVVGIGLMLGGAGALVWHMRDAPPTDSGPDDGAVV
ncbi:MAG: hypothetical protein LC789_03005 [Actinobacteria bacterium]|nr:hypothetical protein [Actinomycetota bacterium]MCA1719598.1 hypothetical protein [Actinomycetota bacterium]